MKTYAAEIKNAVPNSSFTIYLDEHPQSIAGGRAVKPNFEIEIPSKYKGAGKMKIFYQNRSRSFQTVAYSIPIEIGPNKNNVIDYNREPREVPVPKPKAKPVGKSFLKNNLRERVVRKRKKTSTASASKNKEKTNDGNSLLDKLK